MLRWTKAIFMILLAIFVYLWPLTIVVVLFILDLPGNQWNILAYLLVISLLLHYPLAKNAQRTLRYHGEFATRKDKLRAIAPAIINITVSSSIVIYLIAVCNWNFTCPN